jgi:hypothetical protein
MCKELPVILVNKVVDLKKEQSEKMEGQGGGEAQGVAEPKKNKKKLVFGKKTSENFNCSKGIIAQ